MWLRTLPGRRLRAALAITSCAAALSIAAAASAAPPAIEAKRRGRAALRRAAGDGCRARTRGRRLQRRDVRARSAAGVDTGAVATASTPASDGESAPPQIAVPEGIGAAPASTRGAQAAQLAMQYLGVPYVWGGASPSGFDCSGLVMYVDAKLGVSLPHHAATMYGYGVAISYGELAPGDLVYANGLGHMGMYIGGGNYIHAPQTGDVVKISSMSSRSDWIGFRRVA